MGEILAVKVQRSKRLRAGMILSACLVLAACGNDAAQTEGSRLTRDAISQVAQRLMPGGAKPEPVDPARLAASALKSFDGPLVLVQFEKVGLTTVLGEYGRNGPVRTYATPDERTLAFNGGVLVASRGLGNDLMSSDIGATARLVRNRQTGTTERRYRYLDGEGIERPLPMSCRISPAGNEVLQAAGQRINVTLMQETCQTTGQKLTITNTYRVTGNGMVLASRQWIGPALGHVTIQTLRP